MCVGVGGGPRGLGTDGCNLMSLGASPVAKSSEKHGETNAAAYLNGPRRPRP